MGKVFIHRPMKRADLRRASAPKVEPAIYLVPKAPVPDKPVKQRARKSERDPLEVAQENSLRAARHVHALFDKLDLSEIIGIGALVSVLGGVLSRYDEEEFESMLQKINEDIREAMLRTANALRGP